MAYYSEPYASFNRLAKKVKQYESISKEDLFTTCRQMEDLIYSGVDYLLMNTTLVEDSICYLLAEIQAGPIKSRKVYRGKKNKKRVVIGYDVEVGANNRRIFSIGLDAFKLSRIERRKAAPLVKRLIRSMRLSNNFYESILFSFHKETKNYCSMVEELAELKIQFDHFKSYKRPPKKQKGKAVYLVQRMSKLIEDVSYIELTVGTAHPNELYGVVRAVNKLVDRIKLLKEKIFRAYAKMILKPVRRKAFSEPEALDLFQAGSFGLDRAISLYDYRSGVNFSTFAKRWVNQKIHGGAKRSSGPLIRLPGSVYEYHQKIQAVRIKFENDPEKRYTYTNEDIANQLGSSVESLERVLEKIDMVKKTVSLDEAVDKSEKNSDVTTSDRSTSLEDGAERERQYEEEVSSRLHSILDRLNQGDKKLLCLNSGILDGIDNKLDQVEAVREILRQLACKALIQKKLSSATYQGSVESIS